MDKLTYPNMKADLELCKQQLKELCGEERKTAFRRIPPQQIDFDLQFAAAFKELQAYRNTGLMPDEIPHWIPVSERLPKVWRSENGEPIEFNVMLPSAEEATTLCFNGSQWFEFDWSNMEVTGYYTVAYWQLLPQPPKGEKL